MSTISGIPALCPSIFDEEEAPPAPPTPVVPGTPSISVSVPNNANNALDVTWSATANAISYELRHDSVNPPATAVIIDVTSVHRISGLTASALRYVQVRAKSATGAFSAWSTAVSGTPTGTGGGDGTPADGRIYPTDPIWLSEYSGTSPSWSPTVSGYGSKFTFTTGSWGENGESDNREPSPGDQARLNFVSAGATRVLKAGRIDGSDRSEMNADDDSFDGVRNGVGSGFGGRPAMLNAMILTGVKIKDGPFDPAVFPGTDGPHRHSMGHQAKAYWNETTLKGALGGLPDPAIDLTSSFMSSVVSNSEQGFGFKTMMMPYWPTFVDGVVNNGASHSGYIGRPRGIAGIPGLPQYQGDVVPPPQGLRLASFKTGMFKNAGEPWRFVVAFPMCWDGEHEWQPGGTHMAYLDPDGTPPATHPHVIPFIHWFVDTNAPTTLTKAQANVRQSAQVTNANPAAIHFGQRRDYWNYNNVYVAPHAELLLAWDQTFAEAVAWMVNNYCGLGRVDQRGAL